MAEIRELARVHGERAISKLVNLLESTNESVAIRAAEALLDRGYGRPLPAMEPPEPNKPLNTQHDLSKLSDEEFTMFRQARKTVRDMLDKIRMRDQATGPTST